MLDEEYISQFLKDLVDSQISVKDFENKHLKKFLQFDSNDLAHRPANSEAPSLFWILCNTVKGRKLLLQDHELCTKITPEMFAATSSKGINAAIVLLLTPEGQTLFIKHSKFCDHIPLETLKHSLDGAPFNGGNLFWHLCTAEKCRNFLNNTPSLLKKITLEMLTEKPLGKENNPAELLSTSPIGRTILAQIQFLALDRLKRQLNEIVFRNEVQSLLVNFIGNRYGCNSADPQCSRETLLMQLQSLKEQCKSVQWRAEYGKFTEIMKEITELSETRVGYLPDKFLDDTELKNLSTNFNTLKSRVSIINSLINTVGFFQWPVLGKRQSMHSYFPEAKKIDPQGQVEIRPSGPSSEPYPTL